MPEDIKPIPGARPIRPGDLENLWAQEKHHEIVKRAKYLVHDNLEEPPHIQKARQILKERGVDWREAKDKEIFDVLEQLPRPLFHPKLWKREPPPPETSEYHGMMTRVHRSELQYYGFDSTSPGGQFLYSIRNAKQHPEPSSFYQRMKQAGVTIDKIAHFTRRTAGNPHAHLLSLPYRIEERRERFLQDLGRFLAQAQGNRNPIPHTTYQTPSRDNNYIEEGIMKIDGHTLLVDTTLNNSLLQAVQEAGFRPGVIIKEFTFWHDGADQDAKALERASWADYTTTHWLTQNYDVCQRHPGSGFVACNPTIYIKKRSPSLLQALKRSASNLVAKGSFKPQ